MAAASNTPAAVLTTADNTRAVASPTSAETPMSRPRSVGNRPPNPSANACIDGSRRSGSTASAASSVASSVALVPVGGRTLA